MTKLDKLPDQEKIDQFKGTIDYYLWKGIPVARRWPKWQPRESTPAEASNQAAFKYINQIFQSLPPVIQDAYRQMAAQTTRTNKDVAVSLYMMGAIDDMPPDYFASEETLLLLLAQAELIANLTHALASVATDQLRADIISSALPSGAATQTTLADILAKLDVALSTRALEAGGNLADIKTALQLIDDFALGTNKMFGYYSRLSEQKVNLSATVGSNTLTHTAVPAGEIWILQGFSALNANSALISIYKQINQGAFSYTVGHSTNPLAGVWQIWTGQLVLMAGDFPTSYFYSCLAGDDIYSQIWGYKMKVA